MSRSFKKTPRCGNYKNKFLKRYANRKLRRDKNYNLQYGAYKKNYESWDICDFELIARSFSDYWNDLISYWSLNQDLPYPDKEKAYQEWFKYYKSK